jgi:predicted ATPase/DNA-binding CsgD family transcriptional regulator
VLRSAVTRSNANSRESSVSQLPTESSVPLAVSSFIGREQELAEVSRLLSRTRLLTLTGTGGVGKTRLALELARAVAAEGVQHACLVELAPVADSSLVPQTVASALGLALHPRQSPIEAIIQNLRRQHVLLILDNCEHVLQSCAELAHQILTACADVQILATSRQRLGIGGEMTWRVPSMALAPENASVQEVSACDAVQLFVQRAVALSSSFSLSDENAIAIARICRRLDGIPLAIELAAARINVLSVSQIADRLQEGLRLLTGGSRTAPIRQRTLEATFEWSYRLLDPAERAFLVRSSVFVNGWTLEAAESVCSGGAVRSADVLDLSTELIDKSFVSAERSENDSVRYRLLEPLRQFTSERLANEPGVRDVRRRHARWFAGLAHTAAEQYHGPKQGAALSRIELEHANLLAALHWLYESGEIDQADQLAASLWWFWLRRNLQEGRSWLERLLDSAAPKRSELRRANLLMQLAAIAWLQGDFGAAQSWADESLAIARRHKDAPTTAYALGVAGRLGVVRGDYAAARGYFEESLALAREIGDGWWQSRACEGLATVALERGDFPAADHVLEMAVRIARDIGDDWSLATLLNGLGDVARARGQYERAAELYQESVALHDGLGTEPAPTLRHNLAYTAMHRGDLVLAAALFSESLHLYRAYDERRGVAECVIGLAGVAAHIGDRARAAQLLGAAEAMFESLGAELSPSNRADFSRIVAVVRDGWTSSQFSARWTAGHLLGAEKAVEEALAYDVHQDRHRCSPTPEGPLTRREAEVAALIAHGCTNREIADSLVITEGTVERHVANIFRKLGCRSRAQVASWATRSLHTELVGNPG